MVYNQLNPHVRIVVLSTLDKPRTLYDIGKIWYSNIGRFYNDYIIKQTEKAVRLKYITKENKAYKANTPRIILDAVNNINFRFKDNRTNEYVKGYKLKLKSFYNDLKEFSYPTYLNVELIKSISNGDSDIACNLDMQFIVQLPFILRYIEKQNKSVLRLVLSSLNLNDYYRKLSEFENANIYLLDKIKKRDFFGECCAYIINHYYPKFVAGDEDLLSKSFKLIKKEVLQYGRELDGKKH